MTELIEFEPHHMSLLRVQEAQRHHVGGQVIGDAWTVVHDGLPICCGGLVEMWPGRAYAWSLLDEDARLHMLSLTRSIRSLLDASAFRRIEMAVDAGFEQGARWAELLGFKFEVEAKRYMPDGRDAWIYVRV